LNLSLRTKDFGSHENAYLMAVKFYDDLQIYYNKYFSVENEYETDCENRKSMLKFINSIDKIRKSIFFFDYEK